MTNMVLYRKYRPQSLDDLIGQTNVKTALLSAYQADKLAHAYLFYGPRGTGKTSTARILAKMINCQKSDIGNQKSDKLKVPCNKCDNCLSITDGSNLDLIEIDAASNRGIDDIRSLRENIKLAPAVAKKKVYIIDEVHMLTNDAFNALLKTLEEPPNHAIFILATTELQKIPATVVSRAQRLDFNLAKTSELMEILDKISKAELVEIDKEALLEIAKYAQGSFRDAVKFLDQLAPLSKKITAPLVEEIIGAGRIDKIFNILEAISNKNTTQALEYLTKMLAEGVNVKELNLTILDTLRQLLLIKNGLTQMIKKEVGEERCVSLEQLSDMLTQDKVLKLIGCFQKSLENSRFTSTQSLPIEVAVIEGSLEGETLAVNANNTLPTVDNAHLSDIERIQDRWGYILETIKQYNYSLEALLRSSKIADCSDKKVIIKVPYSFHQRMLEAPKSKDLLESVLSDVLERSVQVSTVLGSKPSKTEDLANIELAQDDEIIRVAAEIFNSDNVN